jgi:hypothetical protein
VFDCKIYDIILLAKRESSQPGANWSLNVSGIPYLYSSVPEPGPSESPLRKALGSLVDGKTLSRHIVAAEAVSFENTYMR